jgi:hypothetical protein
VAKVYALPNHKEWKERKGESYESYSAREEKMYAELVAKAEALPIGKYVGAFIRFGVADGHAEYVVHSTSPLQLCHVPYGDAYHAHPILLRGLRVADVKKMVDGEREFAKLFSKRKAA